MTLTLQRLAADLADLDTAYQPADGAQEERVSIPLGGFREALEIEDAALGGAQALTSWSTWFFVMYRQGDETGGLAAEDIKAIVPTNDNAIEVIRALVEKHAREIAALAASEEEAEARQAAEQAAHDESVAATEAFEADGGAAYYLPQGD